MNNPIFINQLHALSANRFALNDLSYDEYQGFLGTLLSYFNQTNLHRHYLIGTDGCHLCDDVQILACRVGLDLTVLELSDADDVLIDTLGVMIPILVTPNALLCYPFGVMDLLNLPSLTKK